MSYFIDIQQACEEEPPVSTNRLTQWIELTLSQQQQSGELTLRLVGPEEMTHLNFTYRKQNKVTNVLAFPANLPKDIKLEVPLLGDVIICPSVLQEESQALKKPLQAHWAHIVVHGVLHLLGFDHVQEEDAPIMQAQEINLLRQLGFSNPYEEEHP
jgi:probable rRNA maturation factor